MSSHFQKCFTHILQKKKHFLLQEKITTFCLLGSAFCSLVKFCYISYYYLVRILPQHVISISLAWNKTISFPRHVTQCQTCNWNYPLRRLSFHNWKQQLNFVHNEVSLHSLQKTLHRYKWQQKHYRNRKIHASSRVNIVVYTDN